MRMTFIRFGTLLDTKILGIIKIFAFEWRFSRCYLSTLSVDP